MKRVALALALLPTTTLSAGAEEQACPSRELHLAAESSCGHGVDAPVRLASWSGLRWLGQGQLVPQAEDLRL